jgi:endonuclease/exonuclease/phosphatase family metal-dependent hydrolase
METFRIATWNTKQGVAPRQKEPELWRWIQETIEPDLIVLTEAKPPKAGFPKDWRGIWVPGGVGNRRPFGTVIAGKNVEIKNTEFRRRKTKSLENRPNPAATFCVDVHRKGEVLCRVLGHYGLMLDSMDGRGALRLLYRELDDVVKEHGDKKLIVAGDFNLWPDYLVGFKDMGLTSVTDLRNSYPKLRSPESGSRIWTHKNGPKASDGMRQELDFIFVSKDIKRNFISTRGGVGDFPDAWDMSDHAPVTVDLDI